MIKQSAGLRKPTIAGKSYATKWSYRDASVWDTKEVMAQARKLAGRQSKRRISCLKCFAIMKHIEFSRHKKLCPGAIGRVG